MTDKFRFVVAGCAAMLFSLSALAQVDASASWRGSGPQKWDCANVGDKAQCEAHNKALDLCGTQRGPAHRTCMDQHMPAHDCKNARNPAQCARQQAAREACKDKAGPERRQCMLERKGKLPRSISSAPR